MGFEQSSATGLTSPFHISHINLFEHKPSRWPEEQILIYGIGPAALIFQTTHTHMHINAPSNLGSSNISVLSSLTMPVLKLRTKSTMKRVSETTLKMIHEGVFSSRKNVMPTGRMIRFPIISSNIKRSQ